MGPAEEAAEVEGSILEVADALASDEWSPKRLNPDLSGGNAGQAIFYDELSRRWPRPAFSLCREGHWAAAIDGLAQAEYLAPSLYGGFTGVGCATILLRSAAESTDGDGGVLEEDDFHASLGAMGILGWRQPFMSQANRKATVPGGRKLCPLRVAPPAFWRDQPVWRWGFSRPQGAVSQRGTGSCSFHPPTQGPGPAFTGRDDR